MAWRNRYQDPAFENKIIDAFVKHYPWLQGQGCRKPTSVWGRIASELYSNTVRFRKWLYNFWSEDRRGLRTKTLAQMCYVCQEPENSLSETTRDIGSTQDKVTEVKICRIKPVSPTEHLNTNVSDFEDPQSWVGIRNNYQELADETDGGPYQELADEADCGPVVPETDATLNSNDKKCQGIVDPLDDSVDIERTERDEEAMAKNLTVPQILSTEQPVGRPKQLKTCVPTFTITVCRSEWRKIYFSTSQSGSQNSWEATLREKIQEHNIFCELTFKCNRVKRNSSQWGKVPFWSGEAKCKFTGCTWLYMTIKKRPKRGARHIRISIEVKGEIRHSASQEYQRHTLQPEGRKTRKEHKGEASNQRRIKRIRRSDPDPLITGNLNEVKCSSVSQNLPSEGNTGADVDVSMILGCLDVQEKQNAAAHFQYKTRNMYLQYIGSSPFMLQMYTDKQLCLLWSLQRSGLCELHLDATRSFVKGPVSTGHPILYYVLCTKSPSSSSCILPIAEMLTDDHSTPNVRFWLAAIARDTVIVTGHHPKPHKIECGLRWVLIRVATEVFNEMTLRRYLLICYDVCVNNQAIDFTVVHICAEHMAELTARHVNKLKLSRQAKKFFLNSFALLQLGKTIQECAEHIKHLNIIFGTKCLTEACRAAISSVRRNLEFQKISTCTHGLGLKDDILERMPKSINQGSPFLKLIPPNDLEEDETINGAYPPNIYYSAKLKRLLAKHVAILPLWSRIMLQAEEGLKPRDGHSDAENWFGIVKNQVLKDRLHCRPAEFVKIMKDTVQERLCAAAEKSAHKHFKKEWLLKSVSTFKDIQHPLVERWSEFPQWTPKKVPKYDRVPSVSLHQGKPGTSDCIPRNDIVQLSRRKKALTDTCPADNLPYVIHMSMEQYPEVKAEIEALESSVDATDTLARVNDAFRGKQQLIGRLEWLTQFEIHRREEEMAAFCVSHFWHTIRDSICDNQDSPTKKQKMKSSKTAEG